MLFPENWSLSYERALSYFREQADVQERGPGRFCFGDCSIEVTALPDEVIGALTLPRTRVVFHGESRDTREIRRRFVSRFISAFNSSRAPF